MDSTQITALDLFAGTGWGVACKRLGIEERGVEIMPEAVATRAANGMETVYRDVWDGLLLSQEMHELLYGAYSLLIASPPCQTFSLAGNGAGRRALNDVIEAIRLHAYKDPQALLEFGERHDPRTALVLTPLAYVHRDRPQYVALEQVPQVLPVWEACAEIMREMGYDVKTAVLHAEQYGVPQTRKRAILVARLGGPVALPTPTHSKYYQQDPGRLDPGVLKWVSMADALGWGATDQPSHTIAGGNAHGPDRWASGGESTRRKLDAKIGTEVWVPNPAPAAASNAQQEYQDRFQVEDVATLQTYTTFRGGHRPNAAVRPADHPAPTIIAGHDTANRGWEDDSPRGVRTATTEEVATFQSYEAPFTWCGNRGKQYLQIGNAVPPLLAQRVLEALTQDPLI